MAHLVAGFASVNQPADEPDLAGAHLTLEAQESRVCSAYERSLVLIRDLRHDEAQVRLAAQLLCNTSAF